MRYEWDEAKDRANRSKHGIGFEAMERFEWETALTDLDDRDDYGELREIAIGFIGDRLFHLTFVDLDNDLLRIISLRPASKREIKRYVEKS